MPSPDYVQVGQYSVFYCVRCAPKIIHALSNGITMSATFDKCDTYGCCHKKDVIVHNIRLPMKSAWFSSENNRWRFSNDCRRLVIKSIESFY